jgi:structural maintenance of chromosome 3 (chondroitin sulfate proteoglycan 6)
MVFIKHVVLKGFRSYKNQTVLSQPFSPHANCVVGANGSGKSNYFFAIRFVLGDMFSSLHASDHKALLHEGTGEHVMSAYVEITFDNADHRFPVEREEVTLRRSIGYKKDEYFLNKKHVTKQEVNNLLESAGFSRSNPYYIVQQGKVNELTLMQERGRLELLKEVAGTRVYDERRDASLKIIKETDGKREKISEVLGYFDQRLGELDEEKEELREFQVLDKRRRGLEYTLYQNELADAEHKLTNVGAGIL